MDNIAKIQPTRMSGAGNTFFIIISNKENTFDRSVLVRKLCNDYIGFATDGVLFLKISNSIPESSNTLENITQNIDADWDFYNSDGSPAEMCGNVARCAGLFYFTKIKAKEKIVFNTAAGIIQVQVLDAFKGVLRVQMPEIKKDFGPKEVMVQNRKVRGFLVNTGVPHFVIQHPPDEELAKQLRQSKEFGDKGANITFVEFDASNFIQAVTFERGVENFTLACGTGAVAAAKFHHECHSEIFSQTVEMPGGLLRVDWKDDIAYLTGPAEFHFDL